MISKASREYIVKNKIRKGIPLTDEERSWCIEVPTPKEKANKTMEKTYTPKEKAKYAIEQRGGDLWMQKWIDWDDKSIPVGKRRVAYVRYLVMVKGVSLQVAKLKSVKFIKA